MLKRQDGIMSKQVLLDQAVLEFDGPGSLPRGMISASTMAALESEEMDGDYILGARMRSVKEVSERVLADRGHYQEVSPERKTSKDPSPLKVKEVTIQGRRYIVCLNEEQRRKDAADRPDSQIQATLA